MTDVRRLLNESLTNMKLIQRTSVLSSRAREVLERFIRILDSISEYRTARTVSAEGFLIRRAKQLIHRAQRTSRLERQH